MTGRGRGCRYCGRCRSCRSQRRASVRRNGATDLDWRGPITLERPTAMESSSAASTESWAASWRSSSPRDMRRPRARTARGKEQNAQRAKSDESCKCKEQRSAETQPLGHQDGKPP